MHYGVDLSDDQHVVAAELAVAYLRKRGDGKKPFAICNAASKTTPANLKAFKAAGARTAVYLYGDWSGSPENQAAAAMRFGLGVACDLESFGSLDKTEIAAWINRFLSKVESESLPTLWYDDISVVSEEQKGISYPRWLAAPSYGPGAKLPVSCVCQQLSPGTVPGITPQVDIDVWRGDEASFDSFFAEP